MNDLVLAIVLVVLVVFAWTVLLEAFRRLSEWRSRRREMIELLTGFSRYQSELERVLEFSHKLRRPRELASRQTVPEIRMDRSTRRAFGENNALRRRSSAGEAGSGEPRKVAAGRLSADPLR